MVLVAMNLLNEILICWVGTHTCSTAVLKEPRRFMRSIVRRSWRSMGDVCSCSSGDRPFQN